jgi:hypothetical protein
LHFHALCGQFVALSAGRSRGTSIQFGSHGFERRRDSFRVTAEHDNYTEFAPDDRLWHDETSRSSIDRLGTSTANP